MHLDCHGIQPAKRVWFLALGLFLLLLLPQVSAALPDTFLKANGYTLCDQSGTGNPVVLRGFNLGGWFVQEGWMCPTQMTDPGNPAATIQASQEDIEQTLTSRFGVATKNQLIAVYQNAWITSQDLDNIAAHGMNLIRVPFSYLTFMEPDGTWKPDAVAFDRLDWVVSEAWARGIYVILDLHQVQGAAGSSTFWNTSVYQDRAVQVWQKVAARYVGNPAVAGYDLLNEPMGSYGTPQWAFMNRCYTAIRAIDPDHVIIIEATWHIWDLPPTSTYGWTNVCYSFHWYNWGQSGNQLLASSDADIKSWTDNVAAGPAGGKVVPAFVGEFCEWDTPEVWRRTIRRFTENNMAWTTWTYKGRNIGAWALYNMPLAQPNVSTDGTAAIASAWQAYATPSLTSYNNTYLRDVLSGPVAGDISVTVPPGGALALTPAQLLSGGTTRSAAASLSISQLAAPVSGTLQVLGSQLVYTPSAGFSGTDSFTFIPFDQTNGLPATRRATVRVQVPNPVSSVGPFAGNDSYATSLNAPLRVSSPGLLANDGDSLGRPLTAQLVGTPDQGTVSVAASGSFQYTPPNGFSGDAHFQYVAIAGGISSGTATATVRVTAPNPLGTHGLTGSYYPNTNWSGTSAVRIDPVVNFSWSSSTGPGLGLPGSYYSVKWQGWITAPYTGSYTLTEVSDDAIGVYVNNQTIIQDWSAHGPRAASGSVNLTGGVPAYLEIYLINYGGGAAAQLYWQHALVPYQLVPTEALSADPSAAPALPSATPVTVSTPSVPSAPSVSSDGSTNPTLYGQTVPGAGVTLTVSNTANGIFSVPLTANGIGDWSWTAQDLRSGSYGATVAVSVAGVNSPSSPRSGFSVGTMPMPVSAATATAGDKSVTITWSPSPGANGYAILVSTSPNGPFTTLTSYTAGFSYTQTGLSDRTTLYYQVVPLNYQATNPAPVQGTASSTLSARSYGALERWRLGNFGIPGNTGVAANDAMPMGDGIANLLKFATNLSGTQRGILPCNVALSGTGLNYNYQRSLGAVSDGMSFVVEWTDSLESGTWSGANVSQTVMSQDATAQQVKAVVPLGLGQRRFLRLRVVTN